MVKIYYFAWLRQKIGKNSEQLTLPTNIQNVADLRDYLIGQSEVYAILQQYDDVIKIAVNQQYVDWQEAIKAGDEIAFFPPVTGG